MCLYIAHSEVAWYSKVEWIARLDIFLLYIDSFVCILAYISSFQCNYYVFFCFFKRQLAHFDGQNSKCHQRIERNNFGYKFI